MNPCLTPRQRELVELAGRPADQFAKRAAEHDRDNIGASALGVELAPVINFEETGHESRARS